MKKRRQHFMKTGSAYGKNVFGGRRQLVTLEDAGDHITKLPKAISS